jgi:hypothetical protein
MYINTSMYIYVYLNSIYICIYTYFYIYVCTHVGIRNLDVGGGHHSHTALVGLGAGGVFDIHVLLASALRNEGSPTPPAPMIGAAVSMGPAGVMGGSNPPSHLGPHQRGGGGGSNLSAVRSNPLSSVIASLLTSDETRLNALRNANAMVADNTAAVAAADRSNSRIDDNGMSIAVATVGGIGSPHIGNIENSSINQRLLSPPSLSSFATSSSVSTLNNRDVSQSPPLSPPLPTVDVDTTASFLSASSILSIHSNSSNNDSDHNVTATDIGGPVASTPLQGSSSNNNSPRTLTAVDIGGPMPMPVASTVLGGGPVACTALASWFDARREVGKVESAIS